MVDRCEFYVLSYKNEERKKALQNRFEKLEIGVTFYDGVNFDDDRIKNFNCHKKAWSYTYGHFDMINKFLTETGKEYGIFCEDDIYLHKDLKNNMNILIEDFNTMNLDLLLLGYISTFKIYDSYMHYHHKHNFAEERPHTYHNYPTELWGAQMYMISRKHAQKLIDTYYNGYAEKSLDPDSGLKPFCSDWTITKDGNRALVYPMYALEDGKTHYDHYGQEVFHQTSFRVNYIETDYV